MSKKHSENFVKLVDDALTRIPEISVDDVKKKMDSGENIEVVDTRESHEYEKGHLPGARHLSKGVIERDIEDEIPDKEKEIILYCGGGYRSALAADNLKKMGYTNVKSMAGGWRSWNENEFDTEG